MISEYKQMCKQSASLIADWKKIDRNELCRIYVTEKSMGSDIADSYLSAILYKFWNVTEHNYYGQKYRIATEGDCIDWTVTGVLKALEQHVWDNSDNVLYGDEKGPEKAVNVCIYSTKINFYQKIQHQKEKVFYESVSLEQLMENASDSYYVPTHDSDNTVDNYIYDVIQEAFNNKDYIKAFALDKVINDDVFEQVEEDGKIYSQFSDKKLRKKLRHLNVNYCRLFAKRYGVDEQSVLDSIHYITDLDYSKLFIKVKNLFKTLKHDKQLIEYLVR